MTGRKTDAPKADQPAGKTSAVKAKRPEGQTKAVKASEATAEKPRTIRSICEEGLLAALPYDQIIANVKEVYPKAVTTPGCISWYRSRLVKRNLLPSGKEMAAARKRAAEADAEVARSGEE
jgi:hypothetical protein